MRNTKSPKLWKIDLVNKVAGIFDKGDMERLPKEWSNGLTVQLPKQGNDKNCDN